MEAQLHELPQKEMQPFQPALSPTILLFYWHTKARFILQATDQVMVSDQIQWITNFRCPDNTKASARDYSLLSPTVHRAEAPQTGYPKRLMDPVEQRIIMQAWSDLRKSDSPCPSASKHGQLDQVARGLSNMVSSIMQIPLPLWTTCFSVWPSLWWREFSSWYLFAIYHGPLLVPVASHPITMHLWEEFGSTHSLYTLPLGRCRQLMTEKMISS